MRCPLGACGTGPFVIAKVFWLIVLFAMPVAIPASCDEDPECDDVSAWAAFTRITLRASATDSGASVNWVGSFDQNTLDASIEIATHGSKEPMNGTVAVVGGHVMMTKGLQLEPGYEIDALDAPVLSMRLVMVLLSRVFPGGPDQVVGTRHIDRRDRVGIQYATPSANGYIPPPWRLKGRASRLSDGTVAFDMALSFSSEDQSKRRSNATMTLKGKLARLDRPVFSDTDSLDGWTTYGLGVQDTTQGSGTVVDYGAKPQTTARFKTIGDVRAFIAADNDPGTLDATKDFTGFWKTKCEDPFGLQIKHIGNGGKYSVVFCGPGGCGEPSTSRPTFITGDKWYEVVSEGELVQIGRSGGRETYYRCTKDTNPVLRYRQ
jgi:hypothetical protein